MPAQSSSLGFLLPHELQALDGLYLLATRAVNELREAHPVGRHLQRPKLPSTLTEGLAAAMVPTVFGPAALARRPRSGRSDIEVTNSDSVPDLLVAVKGTGAARWITVTATDIEAGCLFWLDYTERLETLESPAWLWVFERPLAEWLQPGRITLRQLTRRYGIEPQLLFVDLVSSHPCGGSREEGVSYA